MAKKAALVAPGLLCERFLTGWSDWRFMGCSRHCGDPACGYGCWTVVTETTIDGECIEIGGLIEGSDGKEGRS